MPALSALVIKDIRHHAPIWAWSLLVAITGGAFIGVTVISLHSAVSWSHGRENSAELLQAASIIGSNLVGYAGLTTALVLATTLALTVSAQQRSHALWKVLGVDPARIRTIIIRQVALVGVAGGALGAVLPWRPPWPGSTSPPGASSTSTRPTCPWSCPCTPHH